MITVDLPAQVRCDEPGCTASQPVQLFLMGTGTFAFKPTSHDWQMLLPNGNAGAPWLTRCPEHKKSVQPIGPVLLPPGAQIGPRGPRMNGNGR